MLTQENTEERKEIKMEEVYIDIRKVDYLYICDEFKDKDIVSLKEILVKLDEVLEENVKLKETTEEADEFDLAFESAKDKYYGI